MATYQYTARDDVGNEFTSVYTNIESVRALRNELVKLGYTLLSAQRERAPVRSRRRIRQQDIAAFAYKFAGMYSAGLSITVCLATLERQIDAPALKAVIGDVRRRVQAGASLRAAFECHRDVFSDFFLGMIGAGESAGKLSQTLELSAQYLEKRLDLRQKARAACVYPLVVGLICSIVVACLLIFIVPTFASLYERLHVELPGPTRALTALSRTLRSQGWLFVTAAGVLVLAARRLLARPGVQMRWDKLKLRIPLVGPLNHLILVSQFIRTLGMLIAVGVPIVEALAAAAEATRHQEMTHIAGELRQAVRAGRPLAGSLGAYNLFSPMVVQMVAAGEEAGILPQTLSKGADLLDKEADRLATALLVKLEPALTVIMGVVIGLILMGVYLPMFDYMAALK